MSSKSQKRTSQRLVTSVTHHLVNLKSLILISSFVMTLEDIWFETKHSLIDLLYYLDRILTVVFFLETTLKLFAMGFVVYFSNAWCWLDFVFVGVYLARKIVK